MMFNLPLFNVWDQMWLINARVIQKTEQWCHKAEKTSLVEERNLLSVIALDSCLKLPTDGLAFSLCSVLFYIKLPNLITANATMTTSISLCQ